jgi:hypothetical protein
VVDHTGSAIKGLGVEWCPTAGGEAHSAGAAMTG